MVCEAQEKLIFGKITNHKDIEGIHIKNLNTKINTITNETGNFYIKVTVADSLLISSLTYLPERVVITTENYNKGYINVQLKDLVTQLDEVYLRPKFTGIIEDDIKNIPVNETLNFYDVGIPGFKGKPQEKIPRLIGQVITPTSVNIEALYKKLSGYYKTLKTKRKWQGENDVIVDIIYHYGAPFFEESYQIVPNNLQEFLLFCIETTTVTQDFKRGNYALVLEVFSEKSEVFKERIKNQINEE